MKILLLLASVFLFITYQLSFAQQGEWTWMTGSNSINNSGSYGTQGIASATNSPPANYATATWTDPDGNFWLYGGAINFDAYSDLWKFDPITSMWTWMQGPGTLNQPAVFGTLGVPSPLNTPGARGFGIATWVGSDGNLWMYGGASFTTSGFTNMWTYTIATNEWTWMGDYSYVPNHGQLQVPSASNSPGDRSEMVATWTDNDGNFWFFGGQGGNGSYEDMWKFDPDTNEWTWMNGDSTSGFNVQTFGTVQGQFDITNSPGKRNIYSHWKDLDGHFWIFGGGNPYFHLFGDLWEYDPAINEWAWIGGDTVGYTTGNFSFHCDTDTLDLPRAVSENRACWTDHAGNFWMMSGEFNSSYNSINDLWVYVPWRKDWVWMKGNNTINPVGVFGTQGISDPANIPGGRFGTGNWMDNDCNLWLFGGAKNSGTGFGYLNDLWKYVPDLSCIQTDVCDVVPGPALAASAQSLCEKFCISFFDSSNNNPTAWQWIFPGGNPASSTLQNPTNICYSTPGTYDVTLITTSATGNDTLTLSNYITVYPTPPFPTITQSGYTLTSNSATSYQWQFNNIDIPGATNQSYDVLQSGYYTVIILDQNGCSSSTTTYVLIDGLGDISSESGISLYPNPSNGNFIIELTNAASNQNVRIEIYNTIGQIIFSTQEKVSLPDWKREMDLSTVAEGIYFIELKGENFFSRKKFLITR